MKDQGQCASGWAFAATSAIEANYFIKKGQRIDLSEQQLVDCVIYSSGCEGGNSSYAFSFAYNKGIRNSTEYPYIREKTACQYSNGPYIITKYYRIVGETKIKEVLKSRPVSVGVEATNWQFYSSGVFGNCGKKQQIIML